MAIALGREKWWLAFNALAVAAYLLFAATMWHEPEDLDNAITRGVIELPIVFLVAS
ncbi:MAG TPA: hypothetical protein VGF71_13190 [Caulobacteraceae bacterium]|jgi:hypothetical protein